MRKSNNVEVRVFGHLRVTSDEGDGELGGSKQQAVLLALLVANGGVVSSDRLVDIVWGDSPPRKPYVTLRSYISHLRRLLEPTRLAGDRPAVLLTKSPGYAIDPESVDVDIHRFAAAAHRALALADTAPADQVLAATSAAFAHWPDDGAMSVDRALRPLADFPEEISHLTELHLALSIRHYRAALTAGRASETLVSLEQTAASHPSSEELIALRMTALYQAGRSADALAVFADARHRLLEQFGLDPSPALQELEGQILANDPLLLSPASGPASAPPMLASDPPLAPAGRADALLTLASALPSPDRELSSGVIVGPAGIGKSTLLHAVADTAVGRGCAAVWGRCADTGSTATLRPWISVLRDLYERTADDQVAAVFGPQAGELSWVLPELVARFDLSDLTAPIGNDLSDAITRTLLRWAADRPLLICLEDLHWADPESLVVANHLVDTIAQGGPGAEAVCVVATWRDTDVAAEATQTRAARTRQLADLARSVGTGRIQLEGLTEADVVEVCRTMGQPDPGTDAIQRLTLHTGGNPLFVTELVRAGAAESFETTDTIRDVVLRRLDPLPSSAADVLSAAALCHPSIIEEMLPELTGVDDDELSDCLDAALAARLIEESPHQMGRYRFTHDLLAETLAGELRGRRRTELHATIGDLLEKASAPAADVAHHYLLGASAGTSLQAARFAHRAAAEAEELADFAGAVRLIDAGLEALDLGPDAPVVRIDMLIDRSQTLKFLGEAVESQHTSTKAFELAVEAGEIDLAVVAAIVYIGMPRIDRQQRNAEWLGYWSPPDESVAIMERCLDLMPPDHRWRAAVTLGLSNQMFGAHHDQQRADDLAREGLQLMRKSGDERGLCDGLVSMARAHTRTFSEAESADMLEEAAELAARIGYPKMELRARKALMGIALDRRDLAAAREQAAIAETVAAGQDDPFVQMQAESMLISLDLLTGDFDSARDRIAAGFAAHSAFGDAVLDTFGMQYFTLARNSGSFDAIIAAIEDKLEGYDGPAYGAPLASMLARSGDMDRAVATIRRFSTTQITWGGEGVLQFMTPCYFAEAVADLSLDRPDVLDLAEPLLDALEPARDRMISLVSGADYPGIGSGYRGRLLTALGRTDEAAIELADAIQHLEAIESGPALLWVRLAVAENRAAAGDADAADELQAVADIAASMGMEWAIEWAAVRIQRRLNAQI